MFTAEQEQMFLEVFAATKKRAEENIVMDTARDEEGNETYVIRDNGGAPGKRILFRIEKDVTTQSQIKAQELLTRARRMRIINAIIAVGQEIERNERAFLSAT